MAGHDKVSNASGLLRADAISKLHLYKICTKTYGHPEKMCFKGENGLKISDEKKKRNVILSISEKLIGTQGPKRRQLHKTLVNSKK